MTRQIYTFALITLLSSCFRIAFFIQGGHKPRLEKATYLADFAKTNKIFTDSMLAIKESEILSCISTSASKDLLFDRNGYRIAYERQFENQKCSANIIQTLSALPPIIYTERDSTRQLRMESAKWIYLLIPEVQPKIDITGYDYYLVSYWNTFSGKPNHQDRFEKIRVALAGNKVSKIKHIYVNQDFREEMEFDID